MPDKRFEDQSKFKRSSTAIEKRKDGKKEETIPVSAGAIERVVDFVFNPSNDKIREVTSIDRMQGKLLPQLDVIDVSWNHVFEIASYRQDAKHYKEEYGKEIPVPPSLYGVFTYRTAQWQKSINAMNLKSAIDLALAETETRAGEDDFGRSDPWAESD